MAKYTLNELRAKMGEFRKYVDEFSKVNECETKVEITTGLEYESINDSVVSCRVSDRLLIGTKG